MVVIVGFFRAPDTSKQKTDKIKEAIDSQQPISLVLANYKKSGEKFQNQLYISPISDGNNDLINYVSFQIDVTEKIRYREELELFKKAVESSGHAIYITNRDVTIEYVNKAFEEITGYNKKEIIGKKSKYIDAR